MKGLLSIIILLCCVTFHIYSQDIITLSTGEFDLENNETIEQNAIDKLAGNQVLLLQVNDLRSFYKQNIPFKKVAPRTFIISSSITSLLSVDNIKNLFILPSKFKYHSHLDVQDSDKYTLIVLKGTESEYSQYGEVTTLISDQFSSIINLQLKSQLSLAITEEPSLIYIQKYAFEGHIMNEESRSHAGAPRYGSTYFKDGLDGDGLYIGVGDGGYGKKHIDINDRMTTFNSNGTSSHSTHVTGTIAGNGSLRPSEMGFAPKVNIIAEDFSNIIFNAIAHYNDYGVRYTNNSYATNAPQWNGCDAFGEYDAFSEYIDIQCNSNDEIVHFFASGNYAGSATSCSPLFSRYGSIAEGGQTAKNTITVGNTHKNGSNSISGSSSRGPTKDGRIKPEVAAVGSSVTSTEPTNTYSNKSGTSMACPATVGATTIMVDRFIEINGVYPKADLMRAIITNGTSDRGNPGPDYIYGFGFVDIHQSMQMIENQQYMTGSVSDGTTQSFNISVPAGTKELKVMLHWIDPAATALAIPSIVNDLDLTASSGGTPYQSLVLDPSNPNQNAVQGRDSVNVYEQIIIPNPASSVSIDVEGYDIPQGSQNFVITYFFDDGGLTVTSPSDGSVLKRSSTFDINWTGMNSPTTYKLEYSTDNGTTWTTISTNVSGNYHSDDWNISSSINPTKEGKIRITDNADPTRIGISEGNFHIAPEPSYSVSSPCSGYIEYNINLNANYDAYALYVLENGEWISANTVTFTPAYLSGYDVGETYYTSIAGIFDNNGNPYEGRRVNALPVTIASGNCSFSRDLAVTEILGPNNGRKHTSSELSTTEQIEYEVQNLGTQTINTFDVVYDINGNTSTETITQPITQGQTVIITSTATFDFSAVNDYMISVTIDANENNPGTSGNDELSVMIKHVDNSVLSISTDYLNSYHQGFEQTTSIVIDEERYAIDGANEYDFYPANSSARVRNFVSQNILVGGQKSFSFDSKDPGSLAVSTLEGTYNLSSLSTESVRLDISAILHSENLSAFNILQMRGTDSDNWVEIINFSDYSASAFQIIPFRNIDISSLLSAAGQSFSSSTQLKLTMRSNDAILAMNGLDGVTIDDIRLYYLTDDAAIVDVENLTHISCVENGMMDVVVKLENTAENNLNNISLFYQISNNPAVLVNNNISIPSMAQSDITVSNISVSGSFVDISFWIEHNTDQYPLNDTFKLENVILVPQVTQFPYIEGFETSDHGYVVDGRFPSWERAEPAGTVLNGAVDGIYAFITNASGNYSANELSYLYSPCFDLNFASEPTISYLTQYDLETGYDYAYIQYSDNGNQWKDVPASAIVHNYNISTGFNGTSDKWSSVSIAIPKSEYNNPGQVRYRWVMQSDGGVENEGIAIDHIHVHEKDDIHIGNDMTSSALISGNGDWVDFKVNGDIVGAIKTTENLGQTELKIFFNPNTPIRNDGEQNYLDRSFVITPSNTPPPTADIDIKLYITSEEFLKLQNSNNSFHSPENLDDFGVTQYSGQNEDGSIENNDGVYSFHDADNSLVEPIFGGYGVKINVNSFSEFYMNSGGPMGDDPLPIKWLTFDGIADENFNKISWSYIIDEPIEKITLFRGDSPENITTAIHEYDRQEVNNIIQTHSYVDKTYDKDKVSYYQLSVTYSDGNEEDSKVIYIARNSGGDEISIYPVPFREELTVKTPSLSSVIIRDVNGKVLASKYKDADIHIINTSALPSGMYIVEIEMETIKSYHRLVK